MSTDHDHYEASCAACGATGVYIRSSDDWGRSQESWSGFEMVAAGEPDATRKRSGPYRAKCSCGSSDIRQGAFLKRT